MRPHQILSLNEQCPAPPSHSPAARPAVSVGMITLNEAAAVARVIGEIRATMPTAEIVIVDSSTDQTAAIARAHGAGDSPIPRAGLWACDGSALAELRRRSDRHA